MDLEHNINKFLEDQAKPTPEKPVENIGQTFQETSKINQNDFDAIENIADDSSDLEEPHKALLKLDPQREARNGVTLIDVTTKLLFTSLLKAKGVKKAGGKDRWNEAIEIMDDLEAEAKASKDLSPGQKKAVINVNRTLKKIERLKLSEEEKEIWMDALLPMIENNGYQIPPSMLIVIALINTLAPRVTDLLID